MKLAFAVSLWSLATLGPAQEPKPAPADPPRAAPRLVTEATRGDAAALAALQRPGRVLFADDFESPDSLAKYFEIRGRDEGRAVLSTAAAEAHRGSGALRLTAPARDGRESGAGASAWLGDIGHDRVSFRRYIRFADDYDQGNLHHVGGGLAAVAGRGRWEQMGKAGIRPAGDDRFTASFEPWRDWGRMAAPGYMFVYAYWMEMQVDRDGHFWGNMLGPQPERRVVPPRGRWVCLEHMLVANDPGEADGELAAWIDGELYLHYIGIRWRSAAEVRIKRFDLGIYVHAADRANTVWYDDVVVSTGYVGPVEEGGEAAPRKRN
jgi:hypothetical protein